MKTIIFTLVLLVCLPARAADDDFRRQIQVSTYSRGALIKTNAPGWLAYLGINTNGTFDGSIGSGGTGTNFFSSTYDVIPFYSVSKGSFDAQTNLFAFDSTNIVLAISSPANGLPRMILGDGGLSALLFANGTVYGGTNAFLVYPYTHDFRIQDSSNATIFQATNGAVVVSGITPTNIGASKIVRTDTAGKLTAATIGSGLSFDGVTLDTAGVSGATNAGNWIQIGLTNSALVGNASLNGIDATNFARLQNATANRVVVTSPDSHLTNSTVTTTELGHLSGVTSAVQTALDAKVLKAGDTMTGTLTVTGMTNSALTASRVVGTAADKSQTTTFASAALLDSLTDETGTGVSVFSTTPALVTPKLGTATATSLDVTNSIKAQNIAVSQVVINGADGLLTNSTVTAAQLLTLAPVMVGTVSNAVAASGLLAVDSTKTNGISATLAHMTNAFGLTGDTTKFINGAGALATPTGGETAGTVHSTDLTVDNAIMRVDGTSGTNAQKSVVLIGDSGIITGVNSLTSTNAVTASDFVAGSTNFVTALNLKAPTADPVFTGSLQLPNGAAPTTDAFGELAADNNAWAASHGALQFFDGTVNVYVVAATATDTPTDNQIPKWHTGGTITWEADETAAGGETSGTVHSAGTLVTDNALVRVNGAGGTNIQESVVIVGDSGIVTGVNTLTVTNAITGGTLVLTGTGTNTMSDLNITNVLNAGGITVVTNIVATGTVTGSDFIAGSTNFVSALNLKAPLASPALTGNPTVPNVVLTDSDTTAANTAFVKSNITAVTTGTLAQFGATTSAQLFAVISDETGGSGVAVGSVSPALTGTPTVPNVVITDSSTTIANTAFVKSNITAIAASDTAGTVHSTDLTVDNAVMRSDGTTGTNAQKSVVLIGDSGIITGVNSLTSTNAVTASDFTAGVTNFVAHVALKAALSGPVFTADPQVPNVVLTDSDTTIAPTSFVKSNITAITIFKNISIPADSFMINRTNAATAVTNVYQGTGFFDTPVYSFTDLATNRITRIFNMPENYNAGTVKFKFNWSCTNTTGNVVWWVHGKILPDNGDPNTAWGTSVSVTDAAQTASRPLLTGATGAMTFGGTPAAGGLAVIEVYRDPSDGSDTLAGLAELWTVNLGYTETITAAAW